MACAHFAAIPSAHLSFRLLLPKKLRLFLTLFAAVPIDEAAPETLLPITVAGTPAMGVIGVGCCSRCSSAANARASASSWLVSGTGGWGGGACGAGGPLGVAATAGV